MIHVCILYLQVFLFCRRFLSSVAMVNPKVKSVEDNIIRSAEDKRSYRGLELTNGLKVLLISDPTTDKASAAMDVHIGRAAAFGLLLTLHTFQFILGIVFFCHTCLNKTRQVCWLNCRTHVRPRRIAWIGSFL